LECLGRGRPQRQPCYLFPLTNTGKGGVEHLFPWSGVPPSERAIPPEQPTSGDVTGPSARYPDWHGPQGTPSQPMEPPTPTVAAQNVFGSIRLTAATGEPSWGGRPRADLSNDGSARPHGSRNRGLSASRGAPAPTTTSRIWCQCTLPRSCRGWRVARWPKWDECAGSFASPLFATPSGLAARFLTAILVRFEQRRRWWWCPRRRGARPS